MKHCLSFFIFLFFCQYGMQGQTIILGQGQNAGIIVTTSDNAQNTDGENTTSSQGFLPNLNSSSRFLSQATYGPSIEDIEALASQGIENWIDDQFTINRPFTILSKMQEHQTVRQIGIGNPDEGAFDYFWNFAWWQYAISSPDVLRQRIALALSEFFVISEKSSLGGSPYALSSYYDILLDHSLGNYRELLEAVTFHPGMGTYLTYMNNPKSDTLYNIDWNVSPPDTLSINYIFPDENYAREVMQLFSIGLCELNLDGTCKTDGNGDDIPTYDNVDIAEFAKIFTGFSYGDVMDFGYGPEDYEIGYSIPMQIFNEYHEPGEKRLLNNYVVEERATVDGVADVDEALDNLFNHPNVGPFLGKFLIQRLVTSNPSKAYVTRVSEAFNGSSPYGTERGDMKAVIKAILLDEEARSCAMADDTNYGMLREPFIRYMQLAYAFDFQSTSGEHRNAMRGVDFYVSQRPLGAPSVFNFFQSDYTPIGRIEEEDLVAPEFQITNTQSIAGYFNGLNEWLIDEYYVDAWSVFEGEPDFSDQIGTFDYSDEILLLQEQRFDQLIERLNLILAHGKLTQRTLDAISLLVKDIPIEDDSERVALAIYLVMASPEYLVNR